MHRILLATFIVCSAAAYAKGSSHPKAPDPEPAAVALKPCFIRVSDNAWVNANTVAAINKEVTWRDEKPAIVYYTGKASIWALAPNQDAAIEAFLAQVAHKCK